MKIDWEHLDTQLSESLKYRIVEDHNRFNKLFFELDKAKRALEEAKKNYHDGGLKATELIKDIRCYFADDEETITKDDAEEIRDEFIEICKENT